MVLIATLRTKDHTKSKNVEISDEVAKHLKLLDSMDDVDDETSRFPVTTDTDNFTELISFCELYNKNGGYKPLEIPFQTFETETWVQEYLDKLGDEKIKSLIGCSNFWNCEIFQDIAVKYLVSKNWGPDETETENDTEK